MKAANVEMLMGHDLGISKSYYKPQEKDVMEDYLKVVKNLTISKSIIGVIEKQNEENRFLELEKKLTQDLENKFQQILLKVNVEKLGAPK